MELNRKTVQHQEGGIVRSILVRDGDTVRAGQPLIVVGDVRNDAELNLLRDQLRAERIRNARASAEAALAAKFQVPAELADAPGTSDDVARETALFQARRRTLDEQIASLEAQTRDSRAQAAALTKQIETTAASAKLAADELEINEKLVRQGYVQRARLLQLQRDESDYRSRLAEAQSDLALAQQRSGRAAGAHRAGAQPVSAARDRRGEGIGGARFASSTSAYARRRTRPNDSSCARRSTAG